MAAQRPIERPLQGLLVVLFLLGFGFRLAPLLDHERTLTQWPTEDGYFMLTMARNVALGHGISVAGGTLPTNGTQPGTTFVWALGYLLAGPEQRFGGVLVAQILQLLGATLAGFLLYRLGRRVFAKREEGARMAALAAGVWYASPVAMPHTMNCLETGFYGLMAVIVALMYLAPTPEGRLWGWGRTFGFGVVLGVAFWVRNDSAFLIASVCLGYLLPAWSRREEFRGRLARVVTFGATSVAVASPWLISNYVNFGHIMPVSGRAEALTGHLNIGGVPIVVTEYLLAFLPIPHAISDHPAVIGAAALVVLGVVAMLVRLRASFAPPERRLLFVVGVYLSGMSLFYGVYFGAAWFLPRYFLPFSPFLALLFAAAVFAALKRLPKSLPRQPLAAAGALAMVGAMVFLSLRQYRKGETHPHFQVIAWVEENVPEDVWVGAIQTGTLGFFHDRTVNLDGKVNIAAYEALVAGREAEYVVEDTEIQYMADWRDGMVDWHRTKPLIREHFEILVDDPEANLGVLRRRIP